MKNDLIVKIPNRHTQEEAKRRISSAVETLHAKYGERIGTLEANWDGNMMHGKVSALNVSIGGTVDVQPEQVIITIPLPFMLTMFKEKIQKFIQKNAEKSLLIK